MGAYCAFERLMLGFFQITVELLDQPLDRGRVAFFTTRGNTITVRLSLVLPHKIPLSSISILLLISQKA